MVCSNALARAHSAGNNMRFYPWSHMLSSGSWGHPHFKINVLTRPQSDRLVATTSAVDALLAEASESVPRGVCASWIWGGGRRVSLQAQDASWGAGMRALRDRVPGSRLLQHVVVDEERRGLVADASPAGCTRVLGRGPARQRDPVQDVHSAGAADARRGLARNASPMVCMQRVLGRGPWMCVSNWW